MAFDLNTINAAAAADPAGFIAECDAAYSARIAQAAERIIENLSSSPIVLLSGPSGSGKTTTAMRLRDELMRRGVTSHSVAMDNYFHTVSPETTPRTETGEYDFESPLCMDMALLNEHFTRLSRGESVAVPRFDFTSRSRAADASMSLTLGKNEVAIFEGIHALNGAITAVHPEAFKLYISARSNITDAAGEYAFKGTWLRMVRRVVRDNLFRASDPAETLGMWANVRAGERKYITPYRAQADMQIDTAFAYEPGVMRPIAAELFRQVPEGIGYYEEIAAVAPALERFTAIDAALLAPDAMLREFIGGSRYRY